jgi:plastocyanin
MRNKFIWLGFLGFLALNLGSTLAFAATDAKVHEVELFTKKGTDGAIHWMPETVTVKAGETVRFILKHEAPGGFDFHGFRIKALKALKEGKKIDRTTASNPPASFDVEIPKKLGPKAGKPAMEYPIDCQFHPGHKPAILKVEAADEPAKS